MQLLAGVVAAFALSLALTPAVRALAHRLGVVTRPREDRWNHAPIALLGGLAIPVAFLTSYVLVAPRLPAASPLLWLAMAVFAIGLVDDVFRLKPYTKLVFQLLAAVATASTMPPLPWTGHAVVNDIITLFWLVGITNAVNLLDNMDGLAAGISVIACVFLTINFLLNDQAAAAFVPAVLAGAVLGFLVFNTQPASIFMGDAGSLFLGFLLAGTALLSESGQSRSVAAILFTPVLILLLPIFDTAFVMVTRKLAGRPISQGGCDHTSHRLVALGMSERKAVLTLYALAILAGSLAMAVRFLGTDVVLLVVPGFGLMVLFLGLYLGKVGVYRERQVPSNGTILRALVESPYKRRVFEVLLDVALVALAYYAAYVLRFEDGLPDEQARIFARTALLVIAIQMACFLLGGLYRGLWRYVGVTDVPRIGSLVLAGTLVDAAVVFVMHGFRGPSRAVFVLNAVLLFLFVTGSRLSFRLLDVLLARGAAGHPGNTPLLIYGAGDGGEILIRELLNNAQYDYRPIAFIDDDPRKAGLLLRGVPVYQWSTLPSLLRRFRVREVAISTAKVPESRLDELRGLGVQVRHLRIGLQ